MDWAADEFETVELGDKRLNNRLVKLVKLVKQLAAHPTASIPVACGGWGDTAAAYRLLDNERCDWREIIEAHGRCTVQRMAERAVELPATRFVQVGNRESDILALMQGAQALGWPVDVLMRSKHNRRLPDRALL